MTLSERKALPENKTTKRSSWWFQPRQNGFIFPQISGVKSPKIFELPPPVIAS